VNVVVVSGRKMPIMKNIMDAVPRIMMNPACLCLLEVLSVFSPKYQTVMIMAGRNAQYNTPCCQMMVWVNWGSGEL
jgi:hypothetical protein